MAHRFWATIEACVDVQHHIWWAHHGMAWLQRTVSLLRVRRCALLVFALMVSLTEPLACLVHCQVPMPAAVTGHGHVRLDNNQAITLGFANTFAHAGAQLLPSVFLCDFTQSPNESSSPSSQTDASVVHDHLSLGVLVVTLLVIALVMVQQTPRRSILHNLSQPPLLPPPISAGT